MRISTGIVFPRFIIPLDGFWDFKTDPDVVGEVLSWYHQDRFTGADKIEVPYCFQSQFPELRDYHGLAWYQRVFSVSETHSSCRVILHIGAVNYDPKIWVNGKLVGEFKGGYYPLEVDLTGFIKFEDVNILTIRINHPDYPMINDYPHGKQTVYSFVGGIWQSTYIEITSMVYLSNIHMIPDIDNSKVKILTEINNLPENPENFTIDLKLTSSEGDLTEKEFGCR